MKRFDTFERKKEIFKWIQLMDKREHRKIIFNGKSKLVKSRLN